MESLVLRLASSSLDASPASKRAQVVQQARQLVEQDVPAFATSGTLQDLDCRSDHAVRRVADLYCHAILQPSIHTHDDDVVQQQLWRGLCRILTQSSQEQRHATDIVKSCTRKLVGAAIAIERRIAWLAMLEQIAVQDSPEAPMYVPALTIANALDTETTHNIKNKWIELLLQRVFRGTTIAFPSELRFGVPLLLRCATQKDWTDTLQSTCLLKLRASPERAMEVVAYMVRCLPRHQLDIAGKLESDWMPTLVKQWKSSKPNLSAAAQDIMTTLALMQTPDALVIVSKRLSLSISSALSLADQREGVYQVLTNIVVQLDQEEILAFDADTLSIVLGQLTTALGKETKTVRDAGVKALCLWMVAARRSSGGGGAGYDQAIQFLREPLLQGNATETLWTMGALVDTVHPSVLESITVDLWSGDKTSKLLVKGLQGIVEGASKKYAASSAVPPVEGLLVTYLALVNALASTELELPSGVSKALSAGASSVETTSFLYGQTMTEAVPSNRLVGQLLPRTMALYAKLLAKQEMTSVKLFGEGSAATHALSCCVAYPRAFQQESSTKSILHSVQTILTYQPASADLLILALAETVNALFLQYEQQKLAPHAIREARDPFLPVVDEVASNGLPGAHCSVDSDSVRRVGQLLVKYAEGTAGQARACLLMHMGSSLRMATTRQRRHLRSDLSDVLQTVILPDIKEDGDYDAFFATFAAIVSEYACSYRRDSASSLCEISEAMHNSALSFISSLGGIASMFDTEFDDPKDEEKKHAMIMRKLCIDALATALAGRLSTALENVEAMSEQDIALYRSPMGYLFQDTSHSGADAVDNGKTGRLKVAGKGRRVKGDFGDGLEVEEWERELKMELAQKKTIQPVGATTLTPEDKKVLARQDAERARAGEIIDGDFMRTLSSVRSLCLSDIEIGNASLPILSASVLKSTLSICPAYDAIPNLTEKSFDTLSTLASSVYEIDESHASSIARALIICQHKLIPKEESDSQEARKLEIEVVALPSPCEPAYIVISEMDEFLDCLSGESFSFLFPILKAALTGPRTAPGCGGALRVLDRHTILLDGDEKDALVAPLRRDMAAAVLELLCHDRSQTFTDPSPIETLVKCYQTGSSDKPSRTPALSTSELAPLLNECGALGGHNCRVASMVVIGSIAGVRLNVVKNNPLIENRIWLNCFDADETIHKAARSTWMIVAGSAGESGSVSSLSSPSPLYAVPLLPLLSNSDCSIGAAAAEAFAHAMGRHPSSAGRSVAKLCATFIESYPTQFASDTPTSSIPAPRPPKASAPVPLKKKPIAKISTGLPKKTSLKKKSALAVAGIGQPKSRMTKKKALNSALLKPKQERTVDKDFFDKQFRKEQISQTAEQDSPKKIKIRLGVLQAIASLTMASAEIDLSISSLKLLVAFLVAYGLADGDDGVREAARNSLRDVVASYGDSEEAIAFLLPSFESILSTGVADEDSLGDLDSRKVPRDVSASDRRKEGVVVALGSVALHLRGAENEGKIDSTVDMLLGALNTPSESVQSSVASSLVKLMKKGHTQARIEKLLSDMMKNCLFGDSLAKRRGAAYGISAAVKGSGIASLKKYEVVKQLETACSAGESNAKEGALFAIELLSIRLGLLFEPYVIVLLPSLLKSFSDSSDYVRTAADNTVGAIMGKLSAHGVKLVLPAVLSAFEDPAWRTKQASIHMLGNFSHLAPKQLASALPKVVPKLTEAFSDTHPKVKASAEKALEEISKVVKNPEVSAISEVLLQALTDPAEHTVKALEALIGTEFLHAIDSPSLALIVPVLHRGLRDRAASTKRYAALIAGNICTMINDPRDFVPYLPILIPDLEAVVLDPIPDVRSTSAKALGSLTRGLGEEMFTDLRPWLIGELRNGNRSSAERSGAAQGLAEVLIACGTDVVESVMLDEILPLRSHPQTSIREGVLWVLTFLPPALGQAFTPLLDASLPALIGGLSDDSELVRDVAMRAGRVLIRTHGNVNVDKILPRLESGLTDNDYRIRVASLTLLGDLLSMIGGTSVLKGDGETQDDFRRAERAQAQIALVLGADTRKRVLSGLYMARSDTAAVVRQNAVQVWKTVVSVTARALRDILKVLVGQIVDALASGHPEKTQVAGRCLGDVVHKLGDSVLPEIIPVLRNALYTGDRHTRTGVCVGLSEVIRCSTKDQILRFLEIIVKVVQDALCDEDEGVRKMAASCFQSLHSLVGNRAMDEIVPSLLVALDQTDDDQARSQALNGLTGILSIRSRELLPYIIPKLMHSPITTNHAQALSGIAAVTGATIHMHFNAIIPGLLIELAGFSFDEGDDETKQRELAVRNCARSVCHHVDETGVNWLISEVASKCTNDKAEMRKASCWMFEITVEERKDKRDFYEQVPIILRELLYRLNDENPTVVKAAHAAFASLSKHAPAEELVNHIEFIRNLVASIVSEARHRKGGVGDGEFLLPGFNMPKGLEPVLPIYQRGILYGNATIREVSAAGLGELISLTSTKYLAGPLIIKITGPLLRIVGDRNPSAVKIAILKTLGLILVKGGPGLRAFVPQFQTTFVKALSDPSRQVRIEAIQALALLMPLSTRVDPLLKELVSGSLGKGNSAVTETAGIAAVQAATLEALAVVLHEGGRKAKLRDSVPSALDAGKELVLGHQDEGAREAAAKVVGASCELLGVDTAISVLQTEILAGPRDASAEIRHGRACACHRLLASSVGSSIGESETLMSELNDLIVSYMYDDKGIVKQAACVAVGALVGNSADAAWRLRQVEPSILKTIQSSRESFEVHRSMAQGLCLAMDLCPLEDRVSFVGMTLMDASLQLAMSGSQRVQYAFNDVLWMALRVSDGCAGLETYTGMASFDNSKSMKSLFSKVLSKIKTIDLD